MPMARRNDVRSRWGRGPVSLRKFSLRNFKGLGPASQPLTLSPLTILVGPNSAGKSSYLQGLLMLKQTVESRENDIPLVTNGAYVQLGSLSDVVFRGAGGDPLHIELLWDAILPHITPESPRQVQFKKDQFQLSVAIKPSRTGQMNILSVELIRQSDNVVIYSLRRKDRGAYHLSSDLLSSVEGPNDIRAFQPQKFYRPSRDAMALFAPWRSTIGALCDGLEDMLASIYYLGPLREFPSRIYLRTGELPQDVGLRGEQSVTVLIESLSHGGEKRIIQEVDTWLREFGMAKASRLHRLSNEHSYYVLSLTDPNTSHVVNFANMGFGVSQVLPVIIQSLYSPPDSILIMEQPEIHLHPKAQAVLGDLLISASKDKTVIVETHSEHLLTRLQRRMAEGKVKPKDVAVYYCAPTDNGTSILRIEMDEDGQFLNWPKGFFQEELEDRFAQMRAIALKQAKGE